MKRLSTFIGGLKPPLPNDDGVRNSSRSSLQSFSSIRGSLSRSVSARSRRLLVDNGICRRCRDLDLQKAYDTATTWPQRNGFLVCEMPTSSFEPTCRICEFFGRSCEPTQLRAFPLIPAFMRQTQQATSDSSAQFIDHTLLDSYVLARVPKGTSQADYQPGLEGFLCWQAGTKRPKPLVEVKEVTIEFNPEIVQEWLNECQGAHGNCLPHGWLLWVTKLIDCTNGRAVSVSNLETVPDYVALSYIWGEPNTTSGKPAKEKDRNALPQVVKDAILVTKSLGFRYIWVDRYCVEQEDKARKHEQIMNMDSIYENAALTIIAAAGLDPARGLPGVSSNRLRKEPFQHENFTLSWIPPLATPGDLRIPRRLVFTDHQVYFECRSMACCESLRMNPQTKLENEKQKSGFNTFRLPHLFSIPLLDETGFAPPLHSAPSERFNANPILDAQSSHHKAVTFNAYTQCAAKYSKRTLTFDSDSLNAFGGMIKRFETLDRATLRHLWGIPFFDQRDDTSPGDIVDYAGFFLAGLCWRHHETAMGTRSTKGQTATTATPLPAPRRRKGFPSWSWTGWEGAVTWPRIGSTYEVRAPDPDVTLASIQLSFEDGSTRSIPDVRAPIPGPKTHHQYPKAILLQTSAVESGDLPDVRTWFPSSPGRGDWRVVQQLRSGDLKALRLGAIGEDGYLLIVKKKGRSYYRVGLMRVDSAVVTERVRNQEVRVFKLK
ncbi:hypothetical protein PG989_016339 [Apiospora arundinis]